MRKKTRIIQNLSKKKGLVLDYVPIRQDQSRNEKISKIIRSYINLGYSTSEIARKIGGNKGDVEWFLDNY